MNRRSFLKSIAAGAVTLSSAALIKANTIQPDTVLPEKSFCQIKDYVTHRAIRYPVYQDMYLLGQGGPYDRFLLYPIECKLVILYKDQHCETCTEDYRAFNVSKEDISKINNMSVSELFSYYGDNNFVGGLDNYKACFNFPTKRFDISHITYGGKL